MRISVYVPCHNNESTLPQVLKALREQTRPADQWLFINDRCTDRSPMIAAECGFEVHDLAGKRGLGAGRNRALELATGELLAGFDADVLAEPDYLEILEKQFNASPQSAAIGGRLDERFQELPPDRWRAIHMPLHFGDAPLVNPRLLYGATMAIRVSAARQVQGWNERYESNFEDVDISTRLKAAGLPLLYFPTCRAWHLRRDTVQSVLRNFWAYNYHGFENTLESHKNWLEYRASVYWNWYIKFRIAELGLPQLAVITLLLPWYCAISDLNIMRKNALPVGNLHDLATLASNVLTRYSYDPALIAKIIQLLRARATELDEKTPERGPLDQQIAAVMHTNALHCIPDCLYGNACRDGMAALLKAAIL